MEFSNIRKLVGDVKTLSWFKRLFTPAVGVETLKVIDDHIGEYINDYNTLRNEIDELDSKTKDGDKKLAELEAKITTITVSNEKLKKERDSYKAKLESSYGDIVELKKEITTINHTHEQRVDTLKAKYEQELENCKPTDTTEIDNLKEELETCKKSVSGSKLFTCKQIYAILTYNREGKNALELSKLYNVNKSTITRILNGTTYKNCLKKFKDEEVEAPIYIKKDKHDGKAL